MKSEYDTYKEGKVRGQVKTSKNEWWAGESYKIEFEEIEYDKTKYGTLCLKFKLADPTGGSYPVKVKTKKATQSNSSEGDCEEVELIFQGDFEKFSVIKHLSKAIKILKKNGFYNKFEEMLTPVPSKEDLKDYHDIVYRILNWLLLERKSMKHFKQEIKKKKYFTKLYNVSEASHEQEFDNAVYLIKNRKLPEPIGPVEEFLSKYWGLDGYKKI